MRAYEVVPFGGALRGSVKECLLPGASVGASVKEKAKSGKIRLVLQNFVLLARLPFATLTLLPGRCPGPAGALPLDPEDEDSGGVAYGQ